MKSCKVNLISVHVLRSLFAGLLPPLLNDVKSELVQQLFVCLSHFCQQATEFALERIKLNLVKSEIFVNCVEVVWGFRNAVKEAVV